MRAVPTGVPKIGSDFIFVLFNLLNDLAVEIEYGPAGGALEGLVVESWGAFNLLKGGVDGGERNYQFFEFLRLLRDVVPCHFNAIAVFLFL